MQGKCREKRAPELTRNSGRIKPSPCSAKDRTWLQAWDMDEHILSKHLDADSSEDISPFPLRLFKFIYMFFLCNPCATKHMVSINQLNFILCVFHFLVFYHYSFVGGGDVKFHCIHFMLFSLTEEGGTKLCWCHFNSS